MASNPDLSVGNQSYLCIIPARYPHRIDFMKPERLPSQPLPAAPSIPARPHVFEVHGAQVRDDYAWLKAENWKEVLKDPAALDPEIRACLEQENAYAAAAFAGTEEFQARLVAEMRGRIKEDDSSVPRAGRSLRLFHPLPRGRAASPRLPPAPRRRRRDDPARRRQGGRGPCLLRSRRRRPLARPPAPGLERRHQGLRILHDPRPRPRDAARDLPDEVPQTSGGVVWLNDSSGFYYVELDENHRPVAGQAPPPRHARRRRTRSSTRRRIRASSSSSAPPSRTPSC